MENLTLHNGVQMPLEGFGVFQVPDAAVCRQAVLDAIQTGYRLDLFITTKLWADCAFYAGAKKAFAGGYGI